MCEKQFNIEPVWLTPIEVHKRTGIAIQTLANDRHMRRGFPYSKKGKSVLYFWPDIHSMLESNKIEHENEV